jgi:hypothetical protein
MGSACACCRSDIESEVIRLRLLRSHQQERLATQLIAHEKSEGTVAAIRAINCAIYQLQHPDEPVPDELRHRSPGTDEHHTATGAIPAYQQQDQLAK